MEKEIALNKIKKLTTNYIVCKSKKNINYQQHQLKRL